MKAKKILFITQEIIPYVEENETSLLGKRLPVAAQEDGKEVRIFMPKWGHVNERRNQLHEVIRLSGMNLIINDTDHPLIIKVASMQVSRMQVYFIDNDDFFMKRLMETDKDGKEYEDNIERAIFYARGVLETVKKLRWCPDIIVCQGWIGSIVPFYIKTLYKEEPSFRDSRVIYLAQSRTLKKTTGPELIDSLVYKSIETNIIEQIRKEQYTYEDIVQVATRFSDGVIMGSPEIPDNIVNVITNSGKPIMQYPEVAEEFEHECNEFYDTIFSSDKTEE